MRTNKKTEEILSKVYVFIEDFISKKNFPPSIREIMSNLNINSTSTVKYYLDKLEEKKLIKRASNKNRAIEITAENFEPNAEKSKNITRIPLIGEVAAGTPILAFENYEEVYEFSDNVFSKKGEVFMLTIKGNSMINAGIFNFDKVVVRKQNYANNGDIVVAMINGSATVKRFFKEQNGFRLQPENDTMSPIYCTELDILGKVIGLIRNY